MNRNRLSHILTFIITLIVFASCDNNKEDKKDKKGIPVPSIYSFESRFASGASSVSYSGQIVRNLLVQDMKITIDNLGKSGANASDANNLLPLYETKSENISFNSKTAEGLGNASHSTYSQISSGKNLSGKISSATLVGTGGAFAGKTADALVRAWIDTIKTRAQDPNKLGTKAVYTTANGLDLAQMINKLLLGSVTYYQATGVYLKDIVNQNNTELKSGSTTYTSQEHKWDEAFGYFGAARNYSSYTDADLKSGSKSYKDNITVDNKIDLKSEYNYGFSRNAGKRDVGSASHSPTNFTKDIFEAFLTGRTIIANQGTKSDLNAEMIKAANGWEKVIAATIVHYVNDTEADMKKIGTSEENLPNLYKHWAEMRAFTFNLQYNPNKLISDANLKRLNDIMGDAPVTAAPGTTAHDAYLLKLKEARAILRVSYSFAENNVNNW